jgi:hypothetical protein
MGDLKAMGTISTSNVNNPNSECITLTYAISGVSSLTGVKKLSEELDELHNEEAKVDLELKNYGDKDLQSIKMKYKVKTCSSEKDAHTIKEKLDKFLKKQGGQTTLDVVLKKDDDEE